MVDFSKNVNIVLLDTMVFECWLVSKWESHGPAFNIIYSKYACEIIVNVQTAHLQTGVWPKLSSLTTSII